MADLKFDSVRVTHFQNSDEVPSSNRHNLELDLDTTLDPSTRTPSADSSSTSVESDTAAQPHGFAKSQTYPNSLA